MGKSVNPKKAGLNEPKSHSMMKVKVGWSEVIIACPITTITLNMSFCHVTAVSTAGSGAQLHTTTTKKYEPKSW